MLHRSLVLLLVVAVISPGWAHETSEEIHNPSVSPAAKERLAGETALSRRLRALLEGGESPFLLTPYEQNYILYSYVDDLNIQPYIDAGFADATELKDHEAKFQLSLMFPLRRGILGSDTTLGASFTQKSYWQAASGDVSAPFRESNYEPQLFIAWLPNYELLGWNLRILSAGLNHQSNGRGDPLSRSWNRLYGEAVFERGNWMAGLKAWHRIEESESNDDNPDITRFLGYYRATLAYKLNHHVFTSLGHYNWNTGYASLELGWSYPLNRKVRVYTQLFSGYGDGMIDYNHSQTRFGIGIMLNDLL